jgi:hypothetical protein
MPCDQQIDIGTLHRTQRRLLAAHWNSVFKASSAEVATHRFEVSMPGRSRTS